MQAATKYSYQHLELNSLPGEKWKWIPRLEGYYKISSFGRVKRETFGIIMKNGVSKTIREKIISADVQRFPNHFIGDEVIHLRVKIMREKVIHEVSIARVVYYCFIKKFDLNNMDVVAVTIDSDGRNIRLDNIALYNKFQKQRRIHDRKRFKKQVVYSIDEYKRGLKKSANQNCRQVTQYSMGGIKIKTFLSINAAAVSLSLSDSGILASLKERQISSGGFIWRYGAKARINLKPFLEGRIIHRKELSGTKVSQYSTKGKLIATYLTMADASRKLGIHHSDISENVNGNMQSAGGYIWRKGWGEKQIEILSDSFGEALRAKARWKPVKQFNLRGKYIQTFESVKAAAKSINVESSAISTALKSKSHVSGGFKWSRK